LDDGVRQFKFEKMPFTAEQLFRVFEKYNHAVFPIQILLICAAVAAVVLARKPRGFSGPVVTGVLAFLWFWSGVTYHLTFFTEINPAAYIFAALFVVQACLFIYQGIRKNHLKFRFERNIYGILGAALVVYALVAYPLIGRSRACVFCIPNLWRSLSNGHLHFWLNDVDRETSVVLAVYSGFMGFY